MALLGSIIKRAYQLRNAPEEKKLKTISPVKAQKKQLSKLLRKAQFTAFGEHYKFHQVLSSSNIEKTFKETVPVHNYKSIYKRWWYRSLNGETYVTWPGKVKYFALSSGTSEASSKYIPVTGEMLRGIKRASLRQLVSMVKYDFPLEFYEKGILMIGGSTHLQYNGHYYEGDLSGITAGNIPFWFQHFYKPGRRISRAADWVSNLTKKNSEIALKKLWKLLITILNREYQQACWWVFTISPTFLILTAFISMPIILLCSKKITRNMKSAIRSWKILPSLIIMN